MDKKIEETLKIMQALSDPHRLEVVLCLMHVDERRISVKEYELSKATMSHHISTLLKVKLITVKRDGVYNLYQLSRDYISKEHPEIYQLLQSLAEQCTKPFDL